MKYKIEYENSVLFPNEIANQIEKLENRLGEVKYEPDKMFLAVEHLKGYLIEWFAHHRKFSRKEIKELKFEAGWKTKNDE